MKGGGGGRGIEWAVILKVECRGAVILKVEC